MKIVSSTRSSNKKDHKKIKFCFVRLQVNRRVKNAKRVIEKYIVILNYVIV